jgi:hypothetical protein
MYRQDAQRLRRRVERSENRNGREIPDLQAVN